MIKRRQIWETKDSKLNRKLTKENEISYTRENRREIDKGNKEIEKGNREIRKEKRNKGREKRTNRRLNSPHSATSSSLPSVHSGTSLHRRARGTHSPEVQGNTCTSVMLQEILAIALASSLVLPPSAATVAVSFVTFPDTLSGEEDKERGCLDTLSGVEDKEKGDMCLKKKKFWSGFVSCDRFDRFFFIVIQSMA